MSYDDEFDPAQALFGIEEKPQRGRRSAKRGSRFDTAEDTSRPRPAARTTPSRGIYDHLAMVFRDAPAFVPQGASLLAKLLQDRVEGEDRLTKHMRTGERRSDALIQDLVEYMIRRFWERVPNDQRPGAINTFLHPEWWDALVEETVDHQRTIRIPDTAWRPAGAHTVSPDDPFYAAFIGPDRPAPTGSLSERLSAARRKHTPTTEESN